MAAWDYGYSVGDEGGSFTSLAQFAHGVRVLNEGGAVRRGTNPIVPYVDGEFSEAFKFLDARTLLLDVNLRYTNAAGAVTHTDGEAGHAYENLSELKRLLGWGGRNRRVLRRTAPHQGAVETRIECIGGVEPSDARYKFTFGLRQIDGIWQAQTPSTNQEASVSVFPHAFTIDTGGDYEIGDLKITLTCVSAGSNPSVTLDGKNETITVPGSFSASDVIVVKPGRDPIFTLNGSRYAGITGNRAWWIRLPYGATSEAMTLDADSGTWTLDLEWRDKWL